jgi:hypothetical protein
MGNRMIAGGLGVLAVVTLGGCRALGNNELQDEHTVAAGVRAVTIDGGSGDVTITGSSTDGSIHVKRHAWYHDQKPGETDTVTGDTLTLRTSCGRACSVDYDVTAPKGLQVAGHNGSGDIRLTNVSTASIEVGSGQIRVRTAAGDVSASAGSGDIDISDVTGAVVSKASSGDVTLSNVAGATTAKTDSGDISAAGLSGPKTSARSGSGDVTLQLAAAGSVDVQTSSGDARVTVPTGDKYRVSTATSSGDRQVRVPTEPSADHQLAVHTGSGNINIVAG